MRPYGSYSLREYLKSFAPGEVRIFELAHTELAVEQKLVQVKASQLGIKFSTSMITGVYATPIGKITHLLRIERLVSPTKDTE